MMLIVCVYCSLLVYEYFLCLVGYLFLFKQRSAYEMRISDWSSDVCSSDLLCRADIPQRPQLPAPGPRTRRRNPRKLARSQPLPQYGRTARAEENRTTQSRMTSTMTANLQNLTHTTPPSLIPGVGQGFRRRNRLWRSEEHTSELRSLMRTSYA